MLCVELDGESIVVGDGDLVVTLVATPYEMLRIVFGRRSSAQVEAAAWLGDADRVAAAQTAFHLFDHPLVDITD